MKQPRSIVLWGALLVPSALALAAPAVVRAPGAGERSEQVLLQPGPTRIAAGSYLGLGELGPRRSPEDGSGSLESWIRRPPQRASGDYVDLGARGPTR